MLPWYEVFNPLDGRRIVWVPFGWLAHAVSLLLRVDYLPEGE